MADEFKRRKSDALLKLALEEQLEQDEDMLIYQTEDTIKEQYVFSKEHNKQMKKIFKKAKQVEKQTTYKQKYIQIAAGITIFLWVGTFTVTNVEAFRVPVLRFLKEIKEDYLLLEVEDIDIVSEKFQMYVPTYMPENYVIVDVQENKENFCIKYENSENHDIYMYYYWSKMDMVQINTEGAIVEEMDINGSPAYVVQKEDEIRIHINKGVQRVYLNGRVSYKDALKIMKSIEGIK